jgi:Stress responsive A/B Barrel Domain
MKRVALLLSFITLGLMQVSAQNKKTPAKLLRHVVLFSFKEGSTPEQVKAVTDAFAALPKKIKQIKSFEWGTNNSPESLNQGFTHCFFVTFTSEKDRAIYLPHPDHVAFGNILRPILDKVLVIDYWAEK